MPQSKMTSSASGPAVGFANGAIPVHPVMQLHPSFMTPTGFQVPTAAPGSAVEQKNGNNSSKSTNNNIAMQSSRVGPNMNSHQQRAYAEQQWYLTQQFLGQQKRLREGQ